MTRARFAGSEFQSARHTNILTSKLAVTSHLLPELLPTPDISGLIIDSRAPLVVVDVDEVLGMFVRGFERFLESRGYEMRLTTFALFQNIYRPGDTQHLDVPKETSRKPC